ncbi:PREDICTED: BCL2/adenovirus E1B 19 kDa protein-interacting protein 3 [Nicrophorus vespilloides]|uniref:BCL2/adenovirus E1B 19 kDa protein-interacting protein 3 n=1 Tax=Nicrophorus vespilloides TaxID=110193 RepID=A0ABM1MVV5_NICVS|nr:PREDICTED: BCL2/adenovirus E1B 19 kDa protein-interacting protein 3 [Nicrophorus vespilloides]
MSSKSSVDDLCGESWVHIGSLSLSGSQGGTPGSVTPHVNNEECMRLLREAQRESNNSSTRVSPRSSPKSPPNSPVQGTPLIMEWQSYYVNTENKDDAEYFTDWSSRPDQLPPKNWSFRPPKRGPLSLRHAKLGNDNVFSRKGLCTLFLTNLLSLLLGTGVGIWLSKYGFFVPAIKVR